MNHDEDMKIVVVDRSRAFWDGFVDGLASPVDVFGSDYRCRVRRRSVGDAWDAVGSYLGGAIAKRALELSRRHG